MVFLHKMVNQIISRLLEEKNGTTEKYGIEQTVGRN